MKLSAFSPYIGTAARRALQKRPHIDHSIGEDGTQTREEVILQGISLCAAQISARARFGRLSNHEQRPAAGSFTPLQYGS